MVRCYRDFLLSTFVEQAAEEVFFRFFFHCIHRINVSTRLLLSIESLERKKVTFHKYT